MARKRRVGRPRGSSKKSSYRQRDENFDDEDFAPLLSPETRRGIAIILFLVLAAISILSLFGIAGVLGVSIKYALGQLFGAATWLFPIILLILSYLIILPNRYAIGFINYFGVFLFVISFNGLLHLRLPLDSAIEAAAAGHGGGYLGLLLSWPLQRLMGLWASLIVLVALLLIGLMIAFNTSFSGVAGKSKAVGGLFSRLHQRFASDSDDEEYYSQDDEEDYSDSATETLLAEAAVETPTVAAGAPNSEAKQFSSKTVNEPKPILAKKYKKIDIPLDLLMEQTDKPLAGDIKANQDRIQKTLENFGIAVEMGEVSVGPTVTQYTIKPAEGVKLSQITTLHNDLALALAAHPIRIEAPIPGKSLVGIEVPNQSIATVGLRDILASKEFATRKSSISVVLGKDVAGTPWIGNMTTMPHMLIAGATGSGKTVCINSIIISLLYQNSPSSLRLILVDPKRVELPVYNGVPHLLTPVITDVKKTINALKWLISEMDRRFELLAKTGHRDIHSFNKTSKDKMPYLVLIIDELADLMQTSANEVEGYIIRLAQLARATGIHLVLATQRPSVDVITGLIKANVTTRIAFAVASGTDSRTILDHAGAEKLLGRGDMLYITASLSKPKRLQGVFVSDDEIRRVVEYIKGQNGQPDYDASITEKPASAGNGLDYNGDGDDLLEEARDLVITAGKASASYLQRRLRIGYARAARLLDLLENEGIIGPADGARPRDVLITTEEDLDQNSLNDDEANIEYEETDDDDTAESEESATDTTEAAAVLAEAAEASADDQPTDADDADDEDINKHELI
ncbi:DNA translocase FtsK [Candidatus Falkowbacteria bacterium]|nr:DNA translocase FtsK [Candidatus Falkowbacteria bacterium]